jgi:hypothetical protein
MTEQRRSGPRPMRDAPRMTGPVLVYCTERQAWVVGVWSHNGWTDRSGGVKLAPSHWMPLPAEPQADGEGRLSEH